MSVKKKVKKTSTKSKRNASKKNAKIPSLKRKTAKSKTKKAVKKKTGKPKKKSVKRPEHHPVKIRDEQIHVIGHEPKTRHEKFHEELKHEYHKDDAVVDLFRKEKTPTFFGWLKRYSPVLITLGIGLLTYIYLVFYMFYPTAITQGHYIQFLIVILFIFLIAGILVFLGLRSELLFVRILSFIFVFVIFTFLLLFVLVAHALQAAAT